ncbi:MAG: cyclic nucleotide-binding domain-containing protein [Acidobacteria bacterium]|nr:cyclic nucleotide-binding domain-containing protein [Acidobacteriota bacterium]
MTEPDLIDHLSQHKGLGAAPREELAWLAAHGALRELNTGNILTARGATVEGLFILLSGRIAIFVDRGAGPQKMMEWRGGDVLGLLPYSRLVSPPGDTMAIEPTLILAIHRDHLRDMIRECHDVTAKLVHVMLDRARAFTSSDLQNEKMISLGKLSAGLAHELNNPVAAIERAAALIEDRLDDAGQASRALLASQLTATQLAAVDAVRTACSTPHPTRSPLDAAQYEEAITDWIGDHGLDPAIAEGLLDTSVTIEALDQLAASVDGPALQPVLQWAAAGCSVRAIATEIQDSAMRISGLVTAIKGFTYMDQATVSEPVDLVKGLTNTLTVLKAKARSKSVHVAIHAGPSLPKVRGFAGELNQIWANLLDNAIDAASAHIEVQTALEGQRVAVRIIDDGPGIPEQIRARIFEPFFTTKPVGLGTGLGLDIVRRLVRHNDGEITVESQPGHTEFCVLIPIAEGGTTQP